MQIFIDEFCFHTQKGHLQHDEHGIRCSLSSYLELLDGDHVAIMPTSMRETLD